MPPKSKQQRKRRNDSSRKENFLPIIKEAFDTYAEDGIISIKHAKRALRGVIESNITREEIRSISGEKDYLDWQGFATYCSNKIVQKNKSNDAFSLFDKDEKGLICVEDVERVVKELEEDFTQEEIEEMMNEADPSGEGLIDRESLFRIVRKIDL
mmetsp:Transcript_25560/g.38599  ORF Transcript_25560/g.38599 Transcript_25560/m.38599 type:complete len:155 (-) Transcript_25560:145-609(-)